MAKRKVRGPFHALEDPTELGAGSAMLEPTEAVKTSGTYNVWEDASDAASSLVKGKGKYKDPEEFLVPLVTRPSVKARSRYQSLSLRYPNCHCRHRIPSTPIDLLSCLRLLNPIKGHLITH